MSKRLLKILDSALWLIKHFHFKISCLLYDPTGGFHELHIAYKQVEPYMEVSKKVVMPLFESTSNCHQMQLAMKAQWEAMQMCEFILHSWFEGCLLDCIISVLTDAFSHVSNHMSLTHSALKSGAFNVKGVLSNIVWPFLDKIDNQHLNYGQVQQVCCLELSKKLNLYCKVSHSDMLSFVCAI